MTGAEVIVVVRSGHHIDSFYSSNETRINMQQHLDSIFNGVVQKKTRSVGIGCGLPVNNQQIHPIKKFKKGIETKREYEDATQSKHSYAYE